jgi:hypothetical protein
MIPLEAPRELAALLNPWLARAGAGR